MTTRILVITAVFVFGSQAGAEGAPFQLKVREFQAAVDADSYDTEKDSKRVFENITLDPDKTAIIFMDVWNYHPNDGWLARASKNISEKVVPLVNLMRDNNIKIIHMPHEFDEYGISPLVKPKVDRPRVNLRSIYSPKTVDTNIFPETNEIVLGDYDDELLAECLRKNGVTTLIYAGYALNWCVTHRDSGIFNMKNHGFEIIIVRDCTIAFELPETLEGELAKETIITMIEIHWGTSTTLDDLKRGLSR